MRVVISAGGTGGHIYPALAVIDKIKKEEPDSEFLYIGTTDRMEKDIIPEKGIPYVGIKIKGINRKNAFKNIPVFLDFIKARKIIRKELIEFNPDVVLGFGGYVTAPVITTAKDLGFKTFIHEQNLKPGMSNKYLEKYADIIGVTFEDSIKYFDSSSVIWTGHPRSEEARNVKPIKHKEMGLDKKKKTVLIVMGSLGSLSINEKLINIIPDFKFKDYQVLIVTGKNYYDMYKDIKNIPDNVHIFSYLDNMLEVLTITDLVVSRASAATTLETYANEIPNILVPSPHVTDNHQYENAKILKDKKMAVLLEEKDFNSYNLLKDIDYVFDKDRYKEMCNNTKGFGVNDSTTRIYKIVKKLVDGE